MNKHWFDRKLDKSTPTSIFGIPNKRECLEKNWKNPTIVQRSNQMQIFTITDLVQQSFCNLQKWSLVQRVELKGTVPWTPTSVRAHHENLPLLWTAIPYILLGSTSKTLCSFEVTIEIACSNIIFPWPCFDDSKETDILWQISFLVDTLISPRHAYIYLCFQAVPTKYALPHGVRVLPGILDIPMVLAQVASHDMAFCNLTLP